MIDGQLKNRVNLLWVGLLVEGGLLFVALVLGQLGLFDHQQPLGQIDQVLWKHGIIWGVIATLPLLVYLLVFHYWSPSFLQPMQRFVKVKLKPMFQDSTLLELMILSVMAGFGEELFFRWCLQGGITSTLATGIGSSAAIAVGIIAASLVFGVCHWVNATYGITTIIVGAYFGAVMIWTETWIAPAIAHSLYDFIALIYIVKSGPRHSGTESERFRQTQ